MSDARVLLGIAAFHLLVAVPGFALLSALRLVRPAPWSLLAAGGPAFVVGGVSVGVPLVALVVLGVPVNGAVSLGMIVAVTLVGGLVAWLARRRGRGAPIPWRTGERPPRAELVAERLVLAGIAIYFLVGTVM